MHAPSQFQVLELCNSSGLNARVRLHCAERLIWDAWAPASGTLSCPALNLDRITVAASTCEQATGVLHRVEMRNLPGQGRYVFSLQDDRGALLFGLEAARDGVVQDLWLVNTTEWTVSYQLSINASPYALSGYLPPGAVLKDAWSGALRLDVIVEGRCISQPLDAPAGRWLIETAAEPLGFRLHSVASRRSCP